MDMSGKVFSIGSCAVCQTPSFRKRCSCLLFIDLTAERRAAGPHEVNDREIDTLYKTSPAHPLSAPNASGSWNASLEGGSGAGETPDSVDAVPHFVDSDCRHAHWERARVTAGRGVRSRGDERGCSGYEGSSYRGGYSERVGMYGLCEGGRRHERSSSHSHSPRRTVGGERFERGEPCRWGSDRDLGQWGCGGKERGWGRGRERAVMRGGGRSRSPDDYSVYREVRATFDRARQ